MPIWWKFTRFSLSFDDLANEQFYYFSFIWNKSLYTQTHLAQRYLPRNLFFKRFIVRRFLFFVMSLISDISERKNETKTKKIVIIWCIRFFLSFWAWFRSSRYQWNRIQLFAQNDIWTQNPILFSELVNFHGQTDW